MFVKGQSAVESDSQDFHVGDIETAEPATSMLMREGSVNARCLVPKMMVSEEDTATLTVSI